MAKKIAYLGLAPETIIEVIKVNTKTMESDKKEMRYGEFLSLKKKSGFTYTAFQLGYSQFKNKK